MVGGTDVMWVYGDRDERVPAALAAERVTDALDRVAGDRRAIDRHAALVEALVAAGELVQAIVDAEAEVAGRDHLTDGQAFGGRLLLTLARSVVASTRSGLGGAPFDRAAVDDDLRRLVRRRARDVLRLRRAEGFSHYALYPEAHAAAAEESGLGPSTRVVGLRSIGCPLAAMVAAALGAAPPVFVRPVGDPFNRRIEAAPELLASLAGDGATVAVVDEGPGLSGSSLAAAADWLESGGVAADRIRFFPSHDGLPGGEATAAVLDRFRRTRRHHADLDPVGLVSAMRERWLPDGLGALLAPPEDISGGRWRRHVETADGRAPAVDARRERRKWLVRTESGLWAVRFAGLGPGGRRKLDIARRLAAEGLTPEPSGLVHGLLVERWVEGVRPDPAAKGVRARLIAGAGRYLGRRVRLLAASTGGASLGRLAEMAVRNTGLALGEDAARRLSGRLSAASRLERRVWRTDVDGRLQAVEWVLAADGTIVKTDALDHSSGHDLVGAQDVAWDVAGAIVAFDLDAAEAARLVEAVEAASGRTVDGDLVAFLTPCQAAFQLGLWSTATGGEPGDEALAAARAADCRRRLAAVTGEARGPAAGTDGAGRGFLANGG